MPGIIPNHPQPNHPVPSWIAAQQNAAAEAAMKMMQRGGRGGGGGGMGVGGFASPQTSRLADTLARRAMRRDDRLAAGDYVNQLAVQRGGVPAGGGVTLMPDIPGGAWNAMQENSHNAYLDQRTKRGVVNRLMNGTMTPQEMQNVANAQAYEAGQLPTMMGETNKLGALGQGDRMQAISGVVREAVANGQMTAKDGLSLLNQLGGGGAMQLGDGKPAAANALTSAATAQANREAPGMLAAMGIAPDGNGNAPLLDTDSRWPSLKGIFGGGVGASMLMPGGGPTGMAIGAMNEAQNMWNRGSFFRPSQVDAKIGAILKTQPELAPLMKQVVMEQAKRAQMEDPENFDMQKWLGVNPNMRRLLGMPNE